MAIGDVHCRRKVAATVCEGGHANGVLQDDVGRVVAYKDLVDVLGRELCVDVVQLKVVEALLKYIVCRFTHVSQYYLPIVLYIYIFKTKK